MGRLWAKGALSTFLLASPAFTMVLGLLVGAYRIPVADVVGVVAAEAAERLSSILGFSFSSSYPSVYETILLRIRLPRVLLAMAVGSALAVSGAVLQAVFRNPLVDSYILGISSGAAFGVSLAVGVFSVAEATPFAFVFSLLAVLLTCSLARVGGRVSPISLVLAGIIVNAFFSSFTSLLKFLMEHEKLASVVYWLMGSFANADWHSVEVALPLASAGCLLVYLMRWQLNVLSLGEEARALGVEPGRLRLAMIAVVSLVTSSSVSFCGVIGWVGLMIPHMVRMAFGPDHRLLIPVSTAVGASFMTLADTLARSLASYEIPVGVLTTLLGVPFFAYLLRKTGGGWYAEG